MDAELKAKWIAALRSGTYKQGSGYLSREDEGSTSYCCLGVLFDLHGVEWIANNSRRGCQFDGCHYRANSLKRELSKAFPFIPITLIDKLMKMNDGNCESKRSFPQIADYIEKNL